MKRTKKTNKLIAAIAKNMPKQEYEYIGIVTEKGASLIKSGITKDGNGKTVDPTGSYLKKTPFTREVNHQNRMKTAFDCSGWEGVKRYLRPLVKPELEAGFFGMIDSLVE
jgi:hypothetical protein